jgi:RimJ/RimL family protein N-acetyltransferase
MAGPNPLTYQTLRPMFEQLHGERVLLRPYNQSDASVLQEAIAESRDQLRPWESFADAFQTIEEAQDWIIRRAASWLLRDRFSLGMWHRRSGRYLGQLELWPRGPQGWAIPAFKLAYWVRQSEQGHGYVTEGLRLLTDYAFQLLGAQRVELGIDAKNARSVAVAERNGFVLEGRLRHTAIEEDGALVDNLIFSLVPTDPRWPPATTSSDP